MSASLKIFLVGQMGPAECPTAYAEAFTKLGHRVESLDVDEFYEISFWNRVANRVLRPIGPTPDFWGTGFLNERVLAKARELRPDLVIFFKPIYIKKATLTWLRETCGCQIYSWYPDDAFLPSNASRDFYEAVPLYDCHFTTKSFNVPEFVQNGAVRAEFLPHAVFSSALYPVQVDPARAAKLGADVGFVGTWAFDRRVSYLEQLCADGYSVKIYGNGWENMARRSALRTRGAIQFRPVYNLEMSEVFNSCKIVAAFLRAANRDVQTVRTYEIPACGAFMLHERTQEATEIFREGIEAEYFGSYQEFRDKIDFYLKSKDARLEIARRGYERSRRPDLSYEARAQVMIAQFRNLAAA